MKGLDKRAPGVGGGDCTVGWAGFKYRERFPYTTLIVREVPLTGGEPRFFLTFCFPWFCFLGGYTF